MRLRPTAVTGALAAVALIGAYAAPVASAAARPPAKPGDFNGDGRRDLAFGGPFGSVGKVREAGFVTVVYGANPKRRQVISQNSQGVPGTAEKGDRFGDSLASADFNRDGYADLAVVAPGEDRKSARYSGGRVTLIYGGKKGLSAKAITLPQPGLGPDGRGAKQVIAGDFDGNGKPDLAAVGFGRFWTYRGLSAGKRAGTLTRMNMGFGRHDPDLSTAVGDFTGDRIADLAIAYAWTPEGTDSYVGRVVVFKGTRTGLSRTPFFSDSRYKPFALAAGDFNGDRKADLAVGDIDESVGKIRVFSGKAGGLGAPATITQADAGIPSGSEGDDGFGATLAAGDANGDGKADLAVGLPHRLKGTGAVAMLYARAGGLTGTGARLFDQRTPGIPGSPQILELFGYDLALVDVVAGPRADLVIGAPGGGPNNSGAVFVLPGSPGGTTVKGIKTFYPRDLGIGGRNSRFGWVVLR